MKVTENGVERKINKNTIQELAKKHVPSEERKQFVREVLFRMDGLVLEGYVGMTAPFSTTVVRWNKVTYSHHLQRWGYSLPVADKDAMNVRRKIAETTKFCYFF